MKNKAPYQSLKKAAAMVRKRGQGCDSVLAHISPEEAHYMQQHFGNDVNPQTGLPQFGFFNKFEKMLRKPFKMIAPVAGSIIGGMFGGPAGAIAGGSLGGALTSRRHMLDHALGGAAVGLGHGILSPMVGRGLGLDPSSTFGKMTMMGGQGLGEQLGLGSGMSSFFGGKGKNQQQDSGESSEGSNGGGLGGMGLLNTGLLGATIAGTLLAKNKMPEYGTPQNESMQQAVKRNKHEWSPEMAYRPTPDLKREAKFAPKGYRKTKWKFFPTPEEQEAQLLEAQQEMAESGYERRYAKGGHVKGYYDGSDSGQSDKIRVDLPEDAYILDATHISLSGDGNSLHGAKQNRKFLDSFQKNGIARDEGNTANVKALVSDGEMYVSPKEVKAVGSGSIKKGVKKLDNLRNNLRKHKGVKKFLPPKSKPLTQYLR